MIGQLTLSAQDPEAQITVCAHQGLRSAGKRVVHRGKGALDAKPRAGGTRCMLQSKQPHLHSPRRRLRHFNRACAVCLWDSE